MELVTPPRGIFAAPLDTVTHLWLDNDMSNTAAAEIIASLSGRFDAMPFTGCNAAGIPTKRIVKIIDGWKVEITQANSETHWFASDLHGNAACGMVRA